MKPHTDIDGPAAAWLVPFAQRQLTRFKALIGWGKRYWEFPSGEKVTIWWGGKRDKIRIISGLFGFITATRGPPFQLIKGVISRGGPAPTFLARAVVPPYVSGAIPIWSRNRVTAIFNSGGADDEAMDRIYHAGKVYTPTWNTPAAVGNDSASEVYVSNDGSIVVLARLLWPWVTGETPVLYNKLEYVIDPNPANSGWSETYFQPNFSELRALVESPPGDATYITGSGYDAPHFRLSLNPGFPGTITGGRETYELIGLSPYLSLSPGQTAGQSDHILFRGDFAIPVSATHDLSGFTWDVADTSNPASPVFNPEGSDPGRVTDRFTRFEVTYRTYSFFYKMNLLTGEVTLVKWNEAGFLRHLWLHVTNSAGAGSAEIYPDGVTTHAQWDASSDSPAIFSGKEGKVHLTDPTSVVLGPYFGGHPQPTGQINFGGSSLIAYTARNLDAPTAQGEMFLWTSPSSAILVSLFSSTPVGPTLHVYRDAVEVFSPAVEIDELSMITGPGFPVGSKSGVLYRDADSHISHVAQEYLDWVEPPGGQAVDEHRDAASVVNSPTGKYQHEILYDWDASTSTYTMYEDGEIVHQITGEPIRSVLADAANSEKWYIQMEDEPTILREYTRAKDPDTQELVVSYKEIKLPATIRLDGLEFPTGVFVRPFSTLTQGQPG